MSNFTKTTSYYDYLFVELADPRTSNWLFMKDPGCLLLILAFYLFFVIQLGPRLMKNREPWKLTETLIAYNFFQVLLSTYVFVQAIGKVWVHYSWICQPCDYSDNPDAIMAAELVHTYFVVKITELLDTVFFVLRKKERQITFLHVYHHTVMPLLSWTLAKYIPGGQCTFVGMINSFVHIIMYGYYLLAALGPQYQKYLWWKRYITTLQLVQFCVSVIHNSQVLFIDCGHPKWTVIIILPNAILFYYLFSDFYNMAYRNKENKETNNVAKIKTK